MATVYRFIVEQKTSGGGNGRTFTDKPNKKSAGKKGKLSLFGGSKGGVEHNRIMRPINPVLNKVTGGWWEKGTRIGRAAAGLLKFDAATGALLGFSLTSILIIGAFIATTSMKILDSEQKKADKANKQNFKALENGYGSVHGAFSVASDFWTGARTFNENK